MSREERRDGEHVIVRDFGRHYLRADYGEGIYVFDVDGKRYIDGSAGMSAVVNIGHGVGEIADALAKQARRLAFAPMHMFTHEPIIELTDRLAALAPGSLDKVWLVSGGSEATENAVKLARQIQMERGMSSKHIVISRWQSFHGATIAALGYGGHTARRRRYVPMFENSPHIPPAYPYRCEYCADRGDCTLQCANALEREIRRQGPENICAFIAEPVVGAALGAVPAPEHYFQRIREICTQYDVLFIADEVMTGFGRTGKMFGIDHWDVVPDILVGAKGISGGYSPLGAVVVRREYIELLEQQDSSFVGGHTYIGNPLSAAAALAVLDYLEQHALVENARIQGERLLAGLKDLADHHPIIGDVRGLGLMAAVELVRDRSTKEPFPLADKLSWQIADEALPRGLITYPLQGCIDGVEGDMLKLTPPLCIDGGQVDDMLTILDASLGAVEKRVF
ncbi:MAG: aminotransferase class III-fold pyridoxal phosphate-dependent enzyme [Thermoleophilia bacterium]